MRRKAILGSFLIMSFLVSMFAGTFFGAADSQGGSSLLGSPIPRPGESVDPWPMFHHDLNHIGYSTSTAPNTNQTVWIHRTSSYALTSSPAVVGGVVYVGSTDNNTYALNATWGTQIWNYTTSGPVAWSSPAVVGGVVYVGSNDGNVYALNATTGTRVWKYTTDSAIFSSPAVVGGVVYEGSTDGKVYALNATTGAKVWSYATESEVWSSPAVVGGVVYVGSDDGKVYALNATTGTHLWNYTTDNWVESSPAVDGGMVFAGSYDNNIYALNASTGTFVWSYLTDGYVVSSPAVVGGVVYVGSSDGKVYALNATTGTHLWNYTTSNSVQSSPAVAGGVVYVGSMDRTVYALNATTGALVWSYLTYGWVFSSPAVAGGVVYVGSNDRRIYAFGMQVGIYGQDPTEPAPMGIADYGISPAGPYKYATNSSVGIVTIKSLSTNSSFNDPLVPDTKMSFQLNVNLAFNTSYGKYVYWIQEIMGVDTSNNRVTFANNVWNSSAFRANMSASGISGNGQVDLNAPLSFYYCGVNQSAILSLPGNNITLTYPITITFNVTSGVDSSGEPTVSFAYDDGYGLITYDTVTFTNVTELTSLSGFEVNGFIYKPGGGFYDSELIMGGPSDGYNTHALQSDVRLQLEYWNGHNYEAVPNAYNFGRDTAEGIDNVLSEFSYYPENGRINARIQAGAGKLGELYDQSQTGVFNITSPLTSGTLYVTNASDPNATAWQIPFVGGEVTVTVYPGTYNLQLCNQAGQFFDQGNITVTAGQTLYLQAYAVPRSMEIIEAQNESARVRTVDPAAAYDTASATLLMNCYDTLVFFDGEHADKYQPQLATEWSITQNNPPTHDSETGLDFYQTYYFKIRTGVPFQDPRFGNVTPADAEYCFERGMVLDPSNGPQWMFYEPLVNGESHTYVNGQDWDPAGNLAQRNLLGLMIDHAIESNSTHVWFNLAFPGAYAPFMQILCQTWSSVYSKAWANSLGRPTNWPGNWPDHTSWFDYCNPAVMPFDDPTPAVMGTGPFMLAHLDYDQKYWDAYRFTGYWRGWGNGPAPNYGTDWPAFGGSRPAGFINHYVVTWAYDWNTRSTKFLNGTVDICAVPTQYVSQVMNQPSIRCTYPLPTAGVNVALYQYDINPASPYGPIYDYGALGEAGAPRDFFGNAAYGVYMRKAFSHCINFTSLIADVLLGDAMQPATALIPTLPYHNASIPCYDFDLAEAAELFHQWPGLWETGFTLNLPYNTGTGTAAVMRKALFEMLAANINSLNTKFHVQAVAVPWASYSAADRNKQLPVFTIAWLADFPDPHDFALPYYTTWRGWQGSAFADRQGFSDTTLDSLIAQGINTPDGPARAQIYSQIQQRIIDLCPSVALYSPVSRHFEQTSVCGWYYNPVYPGTYAANLWKWNYTPHAQQGSTPSNSNLLPYDVDYGGAITMKDIALVARSFGTVYGPPVGPYWHFRCDINNDRKIDMKDISAVAKNFNKTSAIWNPS